MDPKIIHVISSLTANGAERLVTDLVCRLAHDGISTPVISLFKAKTGQLDAQLAAAGVEHCCLHKKNWKDYTLLASLKRAIRNLQPSLVHAHLFPANYLVPFCTPVNVKLLTTEHSVTTRRRRTIYGKIADSFVYRKYDSIQCISNDVAQSLSRWTGIQDTIGVIENGVDISRFRKVTTADIRNRFTIPENAFVVGMAGRFEQPPKDQQTIIRAVSQLPDVHCIFAGEGPDYQLLKKTAEETESSARIHFAGYLDKVEELYSGINVYIHSSFYEGFGLSIIEAMSSGVPVIGSDVKAINSIIEDSVNGLLFRQGDAVQLSLQIKKLAQDALLRKKITGNAATTANRYSLTTMVQKYKDIYSSLLSGKI